LATFLEMSGISKRFGGVHALRNVDLTLEVGEVHCLVGENGSGKSTLIKIISGVEEPERGGWIAISGKEYPKLNPVQSTHCGIQVIYQDLSLFPNLNVAENIAMAHHLGGLRRVDWPALRATARIFRAASLMYGKRPNFPELVRWLRAISPSSRSASTPHRSRA